MLVRITKHARLYDILLCLSFIWFCRTLIWVGTPQTEVVLLLDGIIGHEVYHCQSLKICRSVCKL